MSSTWHWMPGICYQLFSYLWLLCRGILSLELISATHRPPPDGSSWLDEYAKKSKPFPWQWTFPSVEPLACCWTSRLPLTWVVSSDLQTSILLDLAFNTGSAVKTTCTVLLYRALSVVGHALLVLDPVTACSFKQVPQPLVIGQRVE